MTSPHKFQGTKQLTDEDLGWFMRNPHFAIISEDAKRRMISCMQSEIVDKDRRLITQGEEGDYFYIIRRGTCLVTVSKGEMNHMIGRMGPGDVVGEMAVVTGEKRFANVDAESDMEVWRAGRADFDDACTEFPKLRHFLTKIVDDRLSHSLFAAERTIGKYVVSDMIGHGGYSVVYRGSHSSLDMPVAVKMLKHDIALDPQFYEWFRAEGKTVAQLNHENIVRVYDVEESYRTFFIVMEYIEGESLAQLIEREERLSIDEALDLMMQICYGLLHAHEKGVVHRDIKPANILLREDGTAKIVDFGFARQVGTKEDSIKGTPYYICPEQIRGRPLDERADIYALGIMAHEMLTGQCPCLGTIPEEILYWHLKQDTKDPRLVLPDLPEDLSELVIRASRRDPDSRYRDIPEMLHDLEPLADRVGIPTRHKVVRKFNMMNLFLVYREEQQQIMRRIVKDFSQELQKVGARLRGTDIKDLLD
jgi:eukaryotic-like serine/threonine-protein kinase